MANNVKCPWCIHKFGNRSAVMAHAMSVHGFHDKIAAQAEVNAVEVKPTLWQRILAWFRPARAWQVVKETLSLGGVRIHGIIRITPTGRRAWVDTNVGPVKKPMEAIPQRIIDRYRNA